jgi:antitoxin (DNA-binding transcriptional repressor) of toxin-antitoxin stability system
MNGAGSREAVLEPQIVTATYAKRNLLSFFERARNGETFIITRWGRRCAALTPPTADDLREYADRCSALESSSSSENPR